MATPEKNTCIEAFHSILDRELIKSFELISYYDAKRHIEKYIQWCNDPRRHREIGRITPCCLSDKQAAMGLPYPLSRPANKPLRTSLDKVMSDPYFGLSVDHQDNEIQNQMENSVQVLDG